MDQATYYYGKYVVKLLPALIRLTVREAASGEEMRGIREGFTPDEEAKYFLNALLESGSDLRNMTVIVCEMNEYGRLDEKFLHALKARARDAAGRVGRLVVVDWSQEVDNDFLFRLDDHTNSEGHRFLAKKIQQFIM